MKTFSKEYNFPLQANDRIILTSVFARGEDLNDMLSNLELYAEYDSGLPIQKLTIDALSLTEYQAIEEDILDFLVGK